MSQARIAELERALAWALRRLADSEVEVKHLQYQLQAETHQPVLIDGFWCCTHHADTANQ